MALILAAVTLLLTSCTHGKQSKQEELYGALECEQGKVYSAQVQEYIGVTTLHANCQSKVEEFGMKENKRGVIKTWCDQDIQAYTYSAYIPVTKDGQVSLLPISIYSYAPIQLSEYPQILIGSDTFSQVAVEARLDISPFTNYTGPGDYIFVAGIESDTEVLQHFQYKGNRKVLSDSQGNDDRP